ncbi:U3 snoRNA-associated 11 [Hyphodiscus hymeniophilus]|uniref:U3 snoRNA-associated 11 n=1 Tax=Hyphodiscus hymeniophilus TaxID=353542 RepID=A0A9P6VHJ5_9HELO|nr:U3 snoRNA-associated 11 [Hyphodiscus hymeniophilus]
MAKKRKAPTQSATAEDRNGFEERGGKLGPIASFEDVADSEDEFHIQRDKVLLDEAPDAKRRRKWAEEDAELEPSDEEVLGYSSAEEEDEEDPVPSKGARIKQYSEDEDAEPEEEEEGWGASRKDYYNADVIETEIDAKEEEEEARHLQQRKLQKMSEADFGFDENDWLDTTNQDEDDGDVVTEVLKDVEITPDMGPEERLRVMQTRYPEFEFLANEFLNLQPVLVELQSQMDSESAGKETIAKCRALAAYLATLSMYFALLTSPSRNSDTHKTLEPAELRDHPIMDSLLQCRSLWTKAKEIKTVVAASVESDVSDDESLADQGEALHTSGLENGSSDKENKSTSRASRLATASASIDDLSTLLPSKRHKPSKAPSKPIAAYDSEDSDFGEADTLSSKAAIEKAAKKKSLRFYTSQITQKSNKRAGAGRDAGGDEDLPYRERFRDRQARLNAEAEARGKKLDSYGRGGAPLGEDGSDDEGQGRVAEQVRGEEDDYYDMVAQTSKNRKKEKSDKAEMMKQAKAADGLLRVVEEYGGDGKRAIGYVIEKNKGLAPKRKKEVRNPRVKKRMKYEEKKRKLASTRAVYKGGEERGGYGGEKTGIKTGLVKSVKL